MYKTSGVVVLVMVALTSTWPVHCCAQAWTNVSNVELGLFPDGSRVKLAAHGDLLACSVFGASGGVVSLRSRHEGGLEQWGPLWSIEETTPYFGHDVVLNGNMLAVGSPGSGVQGECSGEVRLFDISTVLQTGVVSALSTLSAPNGIGGDRLGYTLALKGDTLLAAAVGRLSARSSGAVYVWRVVDGAVNLIGRLQPNMSNTQVPYVRWFGTTIRLAGSELFIGAPFSGFQESGEQLLGTVHRFSIDLDALPGWSQTDVLYDANTIASNGCGFEFLENGRAALGVLGECLVLERTTTAGGGVPSGCASWPFLQAEWDGCAGCTLAITCPQGGPWSIEGSGTINPGDTGLFHSPGAWCVLPGGLAVNWLDQTDNIWNTSIIEVEPSGSWTNVQVLPPLHSIPSCDDMHEPMLAVGDRITRVVTRRGAACGVPVGSIQLAMHVFEP